MEFITTDSKLILTAAAIRQQPLKKKNFSMLLVYAFMAIWFLDHYIEKLNRALESGSAIQWVMLGFYSVLILLFVSLLYNWIFQRFHGRQIPANLIRTIHLSTSEDGLETEVVLKLKSKRYKSFLFRTLEKQHEPFIHQLRRLNPQIAVQ